MEKPDKYYKEIETKLDSGNSTVILKTLKDIHHSGKARILPLIFILLEKHPSTEITEEIFNILAQLKDKDCVPYVVDAISSNRLTKFSAQLLTTCWQSGLDYSEHIVLFAEQFIAGDYQTSIEAFSVIEEWIFESQPATIKSCKNYLVDNIDKVSESKKPLYLELVKVVESHI
jgi:hypothetical protein